jgi:S-adenosylmethionine:tRNA ribosyltransferase-isomerase
MLILRGATSDERGASALEDARMRDLPGALDSGDLLVVNDAATIPASLAATHPSGKPIELRLIGARGEVTFRAALFGAGDWRTPTELRPHPPAVTPGMTLDLGAGLQACVERVYERTARLVDVRLEAPERELWPLLYARARPIQYAHVLAPLELWHVQTPFAARPWAAEMPSAGRVLTFRLLRALAVRGVAVTLVTHAAGLSSIGDAEIDAQLPLPERYDIPNDAIAAIARTRAHGGRVIAVGTTVVRALEGCARNHGGKLVAGEGETDLRISPGFRPRVALGILTGMHEAGSSHFELLQAFAGPSQLGRALTFAEDHGYLGHEFGDAMLILP